MRYAFTLADPESSVNNTLVLRAAIGCAFGAILPAVVIQAVQNLVLGHQSDPKFDPITEFQLAVLIYAALGVAAAMVHGGIQAILLRYRVVSPWRVAIEGLAAGIMTWLGWRFGLTTAAPLPRGDAWIPFALGVLFLAPPAVLTLLVLTVSHVFWGKHAAEAGPG